MASISINYPLLPLLPQWAPLPHTSAYNTTSYNFISLKNPKTAPTTLWRIYNDSSVSRRLPSGGFLAGSPGIIDMNNPEAVGVEIKLHLNWYCPVKTVFISSSENFSWVQYHALKRELKGRINVRVSQISTALALECGVKPFHMMALAEFCQCEIPQRAANSAKDEWVFLGEIPPCAVVADYSVREFTGRAPLPPQFRTGMNWNVFGTPQAQYPAPSALGSRPLVSNTGYGLSLQNPYPSLWQFGTSYPGQGPYNTFISPSLTTSPGSIYEAAMFTGGAGTRYSLPTTVGVGSYISYPTLPDLYSRLATTTRNLARATVAKLGENQHTDNRSRRNMLGYDAGDFGIGSPGMDTADPRLLYLESIYRHDGYLDHSTELGYGADEDVRYEDHRYEDDRYGDDRYEDEDSAYEGSDNEGQKWNSFVRRYWDESH